MRVSLPVRRPHVAVSLVVALLAGLVAPLTVATSEAQAAVETYRRPSGGVYEIQGHGWGHGRGMSQHGALGAARVHGKTWREIVQFYYPGTQIVQLAESEANIRVWISADDEADVRVLPLSGLTVTDTASGFTRALPTGNAYTMWRIRQDASKQYVQSSPDNGAKWTTRFTLTGYDGPLQFSRAHTDPLQRFVRVVLPGGKQADYRGVVRAARTANGATSMHTVNVLPMDWYLRGVVPREMPSSWPQEALRAQTVAARTYAAWHRSRGRYPTYDICDTTACQVYGGLSGGEAASVNEAIEATARTIVMYGATPALTEFSSSNGGHTVASSLPYQVAKPDPWDGAVPNSVNSWSATLPVSVLEAAYPGRGQLTALRILSRDGNGEWGGRVEDVELVFAGTNGTPQTVRTTGRAIYQLHAWPAKLNGLKHQWWTVTNLGDAQVLRKDAPPSLIAWPEGGTGGVNVRFRNTGTETYPAARLTLLRVDREGADPLAGGKVRPGVFLRNHTRPGAADVRPGDEFGMRLPLDVRQVAPGTYPATYKLADDVGVIGEAVAWTFTVRAPSLAGAVTQIGSPGVPRPAAVRDDGFVVVPRDGDRPVRVQVRNTGNVAWPVGGAVLLQSGAVSESAGAGWVSPSRPARVTGVVGRPGATTVRPGDVAFFDVRLHGNGRPPGVRPETFRVVYDGQPGLAGPAVTLQAARVDPAHGLDTWAAAPTPYTEASGRLHLVTTGVDARVERRLRLSDGWSGTTRLGGPVVGGVAVARSKPGVIFVAGRGVDGAVWMRDFTRGLWRPMGLRTDAPPAMAALADGRVLLVAKRLDGTLAVRTFVPATGWGRWESLGPVTFTSGPAAAGDGGSVFVAARVADGRLAVRRFDGRAWNGWSKLAGRMSDANPSLAVEPGTGVAHLVARGGDGRLWARSKAPTQGWTRATPVAALLAGGPGAAGVAAGELHVYARSTDGRLLLWRRVDGAWQAPVPAQ